MLAVGASVHPEHRAWAEKEYDIEIWDSATLLARAGALRQELEALLDSQPQRATLFGIAPDEIEQQLRALGYIVDPPDPVEPEPAPTEGDALIARLRATQTGKNHAKAYEEICRDILSYVFGNDLLDGRSQKRTSDSINVYDLIYRVAPTTPFGRP